MSAEKSARSLDVACEIPEPFLDHIRGHDELARIPALLLPRLAGEIRQKLHETISRVPGHYASNLGVVELTIALHRAFDFRKDRLVLDVGHQCYPHKMLTGRAHLFTALRQENGLCGFPHPRENAEYDLFNTSHAGCAPSSILGLAVAGRHLGGEGRCVAVLGDGAMTAGLVFEALNHAGHLREDLLLVFNDNGCSISYNTGALSDLCALLRASGRSPSDGGPWEDVESIPRIVHRPGTSGQDARKPDVLPEHFFRSLGFEYFGPADGHDIEALERKLLELKARRGPNVLHVRTQKGRGFSWSEEDPVTWHGGKPYLLQGGTAVFKKPAEPRPPEYWEVVSAAVVEAAGTDARVVAITAAMADGTGLKKFEKAFPDRFYDVGICEQHAVCFSAALAKGGLRPVACIYSSFLQRGFDQLMHDVSLQEGLPVVFCLDRAGLVGDDGPTAHGVFDLAYMRSLPHFALAAPKDGVEAAAMVRWALAQGRPVAIRTPKETVPAAPLAAEFAPIQLGKGEILRRGERLAFLAYGASVAQSMRAADVLEKSGLRVTVANARFAKPLDGELLEELLSSHDHVLTVEDHQLANGFGSAVLEEANARGLDARKVVRVGIPDLFVPFGSRAWQLKLCGLDADSLAARAVALLTGSAAALLAR